MGLGISSVNLGQAFDPYSVKITGDQTISGLKDFATRPTVNTFPVALSGEASSNIEQWVKNDYGATIYKAQPVYVSGSNGNNILIHPASNSGEGTSSKTFGLLKQTLLNNEQGYVVTEGPLFNVNTSMATEGDPIWLGPTGNLIYGLANKPKAPQHLVSLGFVERAHANQGKIFVKVQNGFEIDELYDARIVNKQDSDILIYNSGSGLWLNSGVNFGNFETKNSFNIVTPQSGDFILKQSYGPWIYGADTVIDSIMSKWDGAQSSDYYAEFSLEFMGGIINGKIIPKTHPLVGAISSTVDAGSIYFRDDGYGLQPANYVDFLNSIFSGYGLSSRIYAQNSFERFVINYATTEQFQFLFKEIGTPFLNNPQYFQIATIHPYIVYDDVTNSPINGPSQFVRFWSDL